jgi:hypothetical protein
MEAAEFTAAKFNPKRPRDILFQHAEEGLIGILQPPAENGGAVTVRMRPGASVTGRLLDAAGRPRADIRVKTVGPDQASALLAGLLAQQHRDGQGRLIPHRGARAGVPFHVVQ